MKRAFSPRACSFLYFAKCLDRSHPVFLLRSISFYGSTFTSLP